jgi:hypothetical protein
MHSQRGSKSVHEYQQHQSISKNTVRLNQLANTDNVIENKTLMDEIRRLCIVEGCSNSQMRKKIWPLLLHAHKYNDLELQRTITEHEQYDQVEKDVDRSMYKFTRHYSELERSYKRQQLSRLVNSCLILDPTLHYYQGFHDIATVFLLTCGDAVALPCIYRVSHYQLYEAMRIKSLEAVLDVLPLIHRILTLHDPAVGKFLENAGMDVGHYALSWVLTWFSHVIDDLNLVSRLFDVFLASHPLQSVYMSAAVVLERRDELLDTDCEFSAVFSLLNTFPETHTVVTAEWIERVIEKSQQLFHLYPPAKLKHKVPPASKFINYPYDYLKEERSTTDLTKVVLWSTLAISITVASYLLARTSH